ncbi:hypothetical protein CS0771_65820 [Catellatospora sp. IY07-71]|nr:hypothetical protein CS0771_65820 [Catellatospora sp. IY07-71]
MAQRHPSSPPTGQAISDVTYRCSRPKGAQEPKLVIDEAEQHAGAQSCDANHQGHHKKRLGSAIMRATETRRQPPGDEAENNCNASRRAAKGPKHAALYAAKYSNAVTHRRPQPVFTHESGP